MKQLSVSLVLVSLLYVNGKVLPHVQDSAGTVSGQRYIFRIGANNYHNTLKKAQYMLKKIKPKMKQLSMCLVLVSLLHVNGNPLPQVPDLGDTVAGLSGRPTSAGEAPDDLPGVDTLTSIVPEEDEVIGVMPRADIIPGLIPDPDGITGLIPDPDGLTSWITDAEQITDMIAADDELTDTIPDADSFEGVVPGVDRYYQRHHCWYC